MQLIENQLKHLKHWPMLLLLVPGGQAWGGAQFSAGVPGSAGGEVCGGKGWCPCGFCQCACFPGFDPKGIFGGSHPGGHAGALAALSGATWT